MTISRYNICDICKKPKRNLTLQPSLRQMIFGGFPVQMERRCSACERTIVKRIDELLANIGRK